jgi:hypothetical protein
MASGIGIIDVSGDQAVQVSSSADVSGNVNTRRGPQRKLYDGLLLGSDVNTMPSWTQYFVGKRDAYVVSECSSTNHEITRLNAYLSGTEDVDGNDDVFPLYYSKNNRFRYLSYKLSASALLPINPPDLEQFPFVASATIVDGGNPNYRSVYVAASGCYRNYSVFNPAVFSLDVPDYGKIRDIRVWVEFVHDVCPATGAYGIHGNDGSYSGSVSQGLQNVQVALRSPNVSFKYAHPLWNDPKVTNFLKYPNPAVTGSNNQFGTKYQVVPSLLCGTYLLWAGHACEQDLSFALGVESGSLFSYTGSTVDRSYSEYDTDLHIRTVFWDGSATPNPRDLSPLYLNANDQDPGKPSGISGSMCNWPKTDTPSQKWFALNGNSLTATGVTTGTMGSRGISVPWFDDINVSRGKLAPFTMNATSSWPYPTGTWGFSPPPGWLTGPGGTANTNEFPTTGSQFGPDTIQSVYSLLDDVYVKKIVDDVQVTASNPDMPYNRPQIMGFRPGLKGSEIHGRWQLLIGNRADFDANVGMVGRPRAGFWFRQLRLEFIVDTNEGVDQFISSRRRRFKKSSGVYGKEGKKRFKILSGSAQWDIGVNYEFVEQKPEYGRTIGITSLTGTYFDSFAVFSRPTGSLADRLSGSGDFFTKYLSNEFGTPYIPISSGSGVDPTFDIVDTEAAAAARKLADEVLRPKPLIRQSNTLQSHLNRAKIVKSTRDQASRRADLINELGPASGSVA